MLPVSLLPDLAIRFFLSEETNFQMSITPLNFESALIQVRFRFGQMSAEMLKEAGSRLEFKSYVGLHHGVNTAEITDMVQYIASVLL